jgi:hypothetical protein
MQRATPKTKIDTREGFKLPSEYTNEKNLPSEETLNNSGEIFERDYTIIHFS